MKINIGTPNDFHREEPFFRRKSLFSRVFLATAVFALLFVLCTAPAAAHVEHATGDHGISGDWQPINTITDFMGMEAGKNYYLKTDIYLTSTWNAPAGTINLCLNGYVIQQTGSGSVINIPSGATLNLYDCDADKHYFDKDEATGLWSRNTTATESLYNVTGGVITGGDAEYGGGVFVDDGGTFVMNGGNIVGNSAKYYGGGVYLEYVEYVVSSFTMNDGNIVGNIAVFNSGSYGGGVYIEAGGSFTMVDGSISDNRANQHGGGVFNSEGTFEMNGGEIVGNSAEIYGGGVGSSGTFTLSGGSITNNTAEYGGGVYNSESTFTMSGGSIEGNSATEYYGGGVYNYEGTFTMSDGNIEDNIAKTYGGGVYNYNGTFTMNNGNIVGNNVTEFGGGGVSNYEGTFTVNDGNIEGNSAYNDFGGGVYNVEGTFEMNGGSIVGNIGYNGGGVYLEFGNFTMTDGNIVGNRARYDGGGVYNYACIFTMTDGNIEGNIAEDDGGGVYTDGIFEMIGGNIVGNIAEYVGGVYNEQSIFNMSGGIITDNSAEIIGGVYNEGTFTMTGGEIVGNSANGYANGVYHYDEFFIMSDSAKVDEVYLYYSVITVTGTGFTGSATKIYGEELNIGDVIVEIDATSSVLAEDVVDKFTLASDSQTLVVNDEGSALIISDKTTPKISSAALSLSTDIAVRFYVLDSSLEGYTEPYLNITFVGEDFGPITPVADSANHRKVFTFKNISPANMTDEITATLYATKGGEVVTCDTITYSVSKYCCNMINRIDDKTPLTTLCVDLLNYGSASQKFMGEHDMSKFANYTLNPSQESWASSSIDPAITNNFFISDEGDDDVGVWSAAALNLYSDISIVFKFTSDVDASNLKAEIKYGDGLGKIATVTGFADSTYSGGDCKLIKFNKMNAQELNYPVEITLVNKVTGDRSKTLTYSVDAYAYSKKDEGGNLGALLTSIMKYIRAVDVFA